MKQIQFDCVDLHMNGHVESFFAFLSLFFGSFPCTIQYIDFMEIYKINSSSIVNE